MYIYIYTYIYIYIHIYIYIYMYMCVCVYIYIYIYIYTWVLAGGLHAVEGALRGRRGDQAARGGREEAGLCVISLQYDLYNILSSS